MTPKEIRRRLGMTQQQFANYIGISISTVARWELGTTKKISPMAQERLDQIVQEIQATMLEEKLNEKG